MAACIQFSCVIFRSKLQQKIFQDFRLNYEGNLQEMRKIDMESIGS